MLRKLLFLSVALLAVACGTVPEAVYKQTPVSVAESHSETEPVVQAPTATPIPPTATLTPIPPTATPIPPTVPPTAEPTAEASSAEVVIGGENYGADDPLKLSMTFANAERGKELFNTTLEVAGGQQWACGTCHSVADELTRIGPSLLNVGTRALTRVEGEGPYTYLYNSITNSQAYVVPEFVGMVAMPHYGELDGAPATLTNAQVFDIMAYLLTLQKTEVATEPTATRIQPTVTPTSVPPTATKVLPTATPTVEPTADASSSEASSPVIVIGSPEYGADDPLKLSMTFANPERGKELFTTNLEVPGGQQWACGTCHSVADELTRIGPSLLNVGTRALTRVEGEGPYTYLYNSIINSQAYVVPEFVGMVAMPHYGELDGAPATLTNAQVFDIMAYLLTLQK